MTRRHKSDTKVGLLQSALCLEAWNTRELDLLAHLGDIGRFHAGDVIVQRGSRARHVYLVLTGTVTVLDGHRALPLDGALINDREVVNMTDVHATVIAATEVDVIAMTAVNFLRLRATYADLTRSLAARPPRLTTVAPMARARRKNRHLMPAPAATVSAL